MKDLKVWADELGLDWQNDLDVSKGIHKVYERNMVKARKSLLAT